MRITVVLHKQLPHKLYNLLWKQRRTLRPHDGKIPQELIDRNVPVYDGYKFSRRKDRVDFAKWLPREKKILQPEVAYEVSNSIRLTDGEAQVQLLTNSLYHKEMPPDYAEQYQALSLSDMECAWMKNRLETVKHDSFQVRLPKEYHEKYHWIAKERPYGAPVERKCRQISLIFNDFVRLTSSDGAPKPTLNDLTCQYIRPSEKLHLFHGAACSGTLSSKPLPLVGDPSIKGTLPSIYPAAPEMDLEKTFDYDPRTIFPIVSSGRDYSLHTIFVNQPHEVERTREERSGIALLQTFAFAAARAATAKKPLVMQTVYHDEQHVDFVVMQLNTLQGSSENESDVRNQIWHISAPLKEDDGSGVIPNPNVLRWLKVFYAR